MREGAAARALDPHDRATVDEALRLVHAAERRLAARLRPDLAPVPSIEELREGPLGRDLARLARVARGEIREPKEHVLAAVDAVLQLLFWPAGAEDYVVPRAFWETELGKLLARAKLRAFAPAELVTIPEAARRLGVARPTVYRWMDEGKLDAVRDAAAGRTLVVREDVERLARESPEPGLPG